MGRSNRRGGTGGCGNGQGRAQHRGFALGKFTGGHIILYGVEAEHARAGYNHILSAGLHN